MKRLPIWEIMDRMQAYGRTFYDEQDGVLYSNYTCGAFEVDFTGTLLAASFCAIPDTSPSPRAAFPDQDPIPREDWPWNSIFLDGADVPTRTICVHDREDIVLFFSEKAETHRIKIVKLTENFRTALGISAFTAEGTLNIFQRESHEVIEFIGDSITCGFGNSASDVSHEFEASEENGWLTHGAIAARALELEPRFVSVSGISVAKSSAMPNLYGMNELYPYTDRIIQDKLAQKRGSPSVEYLPFDFANHPARYIVLNLGTNDASQIYFRPDKKQAEIDFRENYRAFVSTIRQLNGPKANIICALGCMDYYLFDTVKSIVSRLRADTKDKNIFIFKYNKMMNIGPDAGACLHPSIHRHQLMAQELVTFIQNLPQE